MKVCTFKSVKEITHFLPFIIANTKVLAPETGPESPNSTNSSLKYFLLQFSSKQGPHSSESSRQVQQQPIDKSLQNATPAPGQRIEPPGRHTCPAAALPDRSRARRRTGGRRTSRPRPLGRQAGPDQPALPTGAAHPAAHGPPPGPPVPPPPLPADREWAVCSIGVLDSQGGQSLRGPQTRRPPPVDAGPGTPARAIGGPNRPGGPDRPDRPDRPGGLS